MVEPTAAVLLAIKDEFGDSIVFQKGLSWLLSCQHQDGGCGIDESDPEIGWHTSWALMVLKNVIPECEVILKAVEWLTFVPTYKITYDVFKNQQYLINYEATALIWPWLPGQGCWIEPTALTVIALEGLAKPQVADIRIKAAVEYFRQTRTPVGGWSVGNAGVYETVVQPHAYRTALVLIALTQSFPKEIFPTDLKALQYDLKEDPSILSLSSSLVAIKNFGDFDETIHKQIIDSQLQNGSWRNNPFLTAWSLLALQGYL